jgi:hypothetical protein
LYALNKEIGYELDLLRQGPKWNANTKTIAPAWYKTRRSAQDSPAPAAGHKDFCFFSEHSMPFHTLYCMMLNHLYFPESEFALVGPSGHLCRQQHNTGAKNTTTASTTTTTTFTSSWIRPMVWDKPKTSRGTSNRSNKSSEHNSSSSQCWVIMLDGSLPDFIITNYLPEKPVTAYVYDTFASAAANKYEAIQVPSTRQACTFATEIVSPVMTMKDINLKSDSEFDRFMRNVSANGQFRQWHSDATSNHVHLSYDNPSFFRNPARLLKVCMAYWYFEPVLLMLCRHTRRSNDYCWSLRQFLKGKIMSDSDYAMHVEFGSKLYLTAMSRDRFKEVYHKIFHTATITNYASILKDLGLSDDYQSIAYLFQHLEYRTSALNLTNLVPGGTGTIEIRIKHGSADTTENKMWIHLLANMFYVAFTDTKLISERWDDKFINSAWDLYDQLASQTHWTKSTSLHINSDIASNLQNVLQIMERYCPDKKVWTYWMNTLTNTHTICNVSSRDAACTPHDKAVAAQKAKKKAAAAKRRRTKTAAI